MGLMRILRVFQDHLSFLTISGEDPELLIITCYVDQILIFYKCMDLANFLLYDVMILVTRN